MPTIDELLTTAVRESASDVYLKAGGYPVLRVHGDMQSARGWPRLTPDDTAKIAAAIMNERHKERFKHEAEVDLSYHISGVGRFRCNIHRQRGTVGMVFRIITSNIKTVEELNLPAVIKEIATERRGMILVTGSTGAGKSTTLASMIEQINTTRTAHIITIEDPIEFAYKDKKSFVIQREVDSDTLSFKSALRGALRQNPDVIMVGEMRDVETVETALMAAAAGTLVLSSLHTLDSTETIQRIVAMFPSPQQQGIRMMLASVIKAIISVRLVRTNDGHGRVPAVEILRTSSLIRECIIQPDRTNSIRDLIAKGRDVGMQTFDQALLDQYTKGVVNLEDALMFATIPDDFMLLVKGLQVAKAGQVIGAPEAASAVAAEGISRL
ncbi:MAG: PilT/PilU family type 4a pilus ATPase [Acidobacteria bacterium]|nr:PilT/PilU family type 4a pilus ATPase [Acidobacteriota bacterium]